MPDPKEIAAGLSEAQRLLLSGLPVGNRRADRRTADALIRRGLAERKGHIPNPHMPAWPYPALRPTPAGAAVRAELERRDA